MSSGIVPSSFNRKIFPDKESSSCGKCEDSDMVPVPIYNFLSGPNFKKPPFVNTEPGILSKIVFASTSLFLDSVIWIILFHNSPFSSYVKKT